MNDQFLAWIRFTVTATIGAVITAWLANLKILDKATIESFSSTIQASITVIAYIALTSAAKRWPVINRVLSLLLSANGPTFSNTEKK